MLQLKEMVIDSNKHLLSTKNSEIFVYFNNNNEICTCKDYMVLILKKPVHLFLTIIINIKYDYEKIIVFLHDDYVVNANKFH